MIIRSPYPDVEIPMRSLPDFVLEAVREHGDEVAFIEGLSGDLMTYGQFADAIDRTAAGLAERGLTRGDVCLLYSPNCIEWPIAYYAILKLGGVVALANPLQTADEVAGQAKDSGSSWLFTSAMVLEPALDGAGKAGIENVVVFGQEQAVPDRSVSFSQLMRTDGSPPDVTLDPLDIAILPYSSGTTGRPKGVMLTHRNLVANAAQIRASDMPFRDNSCFIAVIPFAHMAGLTSFIHMTPLLGGRTVILPRFDLEWFLSAIQKYRVQNIFAAPPIVLALAKHPLVDQYDLSSLEVIMSASAPLRDELARACAARLGCRVIRAYGITEMSPVISLPQVTSNKPASVGVPLPNMELKVVNPETGAELDVNELGAIWVRGPNAMKGYLNRPDATAETITDDGWLKTGDIGYADEDGEIFIVDRLKEMIKYKGYQVAPAELEDVLISHPDIADAAVIGVPDEEAGEIPKAFVVRSGEVSEQEIIDFVALRVAPYKKIRSVEFIDEIPRAVTGKILRRVLIERERGAVAAA